MREEKTNGIEQQQKLNFKIKIRNELNFRYMHIITI